jgi:hypothetical protein
MQELLKALIAAKAEFGPLPKNKSNPYHKSRYTSLDVILAAVEGPLAKHGMAIVHHAGDGLYTTSIYHIESEQVISSSLPLPEHTDPQKLGSAVTYYRRYQLTGLLSICSDEDDDGNQATQKSPTSAPVTGTRSANCQTAKPPAKADPLYLLKRNVGLAFKSLGWTGEQITEWNDTNFGGRPSAKWATEDWQRANQMLSALVDQDVAEVAHV